MSFSPATGQTIWETAKGTLTVTEIEIGAENVNMTRGVWVKICVGERTRGIGIVKGIDTETTMTAVSQQVHIDLLMTENAAAVQLCKNGALTGRTVQSEIGTAGAGAAGAVHESGHADRLLLYSESMDAAEALSAIAVPLHPETQAVVTRTLMLGMSRLKDTGALPLLHIELLLVGSDSQTQRCRHVSACFP